MRAAALLGLGAAAVVVVLGFTLLAGSSKSRARASLQLVRSTPLTVRGEHFRSGEQVRVSTAKNVTRTSADDGGRFVVTIRGATRCNTARILARGSRGSYAVLKLLPAPMCLPARTG